MLSQNKLKIILAEQVQFVDFRTTSVSSLFLLARNFIAEDSVSLVVELVLRTTTGSGSRELGGTSLPPKIRIPMEVRSKRARRLLSLEGEKHRDFFLPCLDSSQHHISPPLARNFPNTRTGFT